VKVVRPKFPPGDPHRRGPRIATDPVMASCPVAVGRFHHCVPESDPPRRLAAQSSNASMEWNSPAISGHEEER
jgi:hypothetical protein